MNTEIGELNHVFGSIKVYRKYWMGDVIMYELHECIELEPKSTPVYVPQTTRMLNTKDERILTEAEIPLGTHNYVVL